MLRVHPAASLWDGRADGSADGSASLSRWPWQFDAECDSLRKLDWGHSLEAVAEADRLYRERQEGNLDPDIKPARRRRAGACA